MSSLVVVTFDQESSAEEALRSIRGLESAKQIALSDTAVITKDGSGELHVKNELSTGAEAGAVAGGMIGLITSFIFPVVGTVVGAGIGGFVGSKFHTGVDKNFVTEVKDSLTPGSSALILLIKNAEPTAAVAAFKPFQGKVYQTNLSPDLEESLSRALSS